MLNRSMKPMVKRRGARENQSGCAHDLLHVPVEAQLNHNSPAHRQGCTLSTSLARICLVSAAVPSTNCSDNMR